MSDTNMTLAMPSPAIQITVDVTQWPEHLRQRLLAVARDLQAEVALPLPEDLESTGWTKELVEEALTALTASGAGVQVKAIRRAAENGGFVSRSEVYELGDYPSGRSLRGFSRPSNRIVQTMRESGKLPEDAAELLETQYDPNGKGYRPTTGFSVPPEIVKHLLG
ncbi:hypothetical protein GB931_16990 [Modestobacter sp. I12A-02628]|uniref:Uncharacterized protein n=1 Tax=Goekera deserti TaxID=2497753 RepID=A0A7K3WFF0_9ACTN|nr:hypothetical protein [Goekera deserti]MPQ99581.1 hypothetical protein [Goekera deserti]NDI46408.1 hypothetical protein [Goekera deserti]NEL54659.1 hypothetical protein [Goekera deserti]